VGRYVHFILSVLQMKTLFMQHVYLFHWTWLWLFVSTIVNSLQTGLLTSELVLTLSLFCTNLYWNEWSLVLMSRDVNHPISWHPWCDVIPGESQRCFILNWHFDVSRLPARKFSVKSLESVNWNQFIPWTRKKLLMLYYSILAWLVGCLTAR